MQCKSFNVVHLAVALLVVMVIVVIVTVLNEANTRDRRRSPGSTVMRAFHQGLVTYANSNKNFYPGLDSDGAEDTRLIAPAGKQIDEGLSPQRAGLSVESRFAILIIGDYVPGEYFIQPEETDLSKELWTNKGPVTSTNYSYAMLQIPEKGGRYFEWSQTLNSQAVVMSDRNIGTTSEPSSIHSTAGDPWMGRVLWNDNHVAFENGDDFETKYGASDLNVKDRLFESQGTDDALLIHTGNEQE